VTGVVVSSLEGHAPVDVILKDGRTLSTPGFPKLSVRV